ncbi:unnamed protein product [Rotaria magnacalcarata]|uniref:Uncharacterized protein n=1 Tax=Rotaria magnacalcarata TaxID=392030 RepID=A0A8S3EBY9_9BILA|nr:unnamed protein product [Rotaria magnacalcarata]
MFILNVNNINSSKSQSENFEIKQQDEIQSAHWSCKSISIFTAHAWSGTDHYSFALVSDNISHDKYCINNCITYVIKKMQKKLPSLEEILFFSDGAASQFKQRYLIRNLARMSNNFSFLLSWHFFATSHAKGVVDGIGGTAVDFVNIAKSKTKVIIIDEITQEDIDKSTSELHSFFSNTASVKNMQKLHSITVLRQDTIECRLYDYSDEKWTVHF